MLARNLFLFFLWSKTEMLGSFNQYSVEKDAMKTNGDWGCQSLTSSFVFHIQFGTAWGWVNDWIRIFCLKYPFRQAFFFFFVLNEIWTTPHKPTWRCVNSHITPRGLEFSLHFIKLPSEYIGAKRWGKATRTTSIWLAPAERWGCRGLLWYWICQGEL